MISKNIRFDSELDRITNDAVRVLNKLFWNSTDPKIMLNGLEEIRQLLECMLLGTADYGLAALRIDNAKRFVESDEFGAAKYELRMLLGGLKLRLGASSLQPSPAL